MGQAKLKQRTAFAPELVEAWEADDCVDFAVALARITGWLLHVDWWTPSMDPSGDVPIERFKPLRVYVADSGDGVFDVRGIRRIGEFNQKTITPRAKRYGNGGVVTRYYAETGLAGLPLSRQPDAAKIAAADSAIRKNPAYLAAIPVRAPAALPAHVAARFTYGHCVPFAEALSEATGLVSTAILASRFTPEFASTRRSPTGFIHSVVLHPDGQAEDSWGKAPLSEIAARFGVLEFSLSSDEHQATAARLRRSSPERFEAAIDDARQAIAVHR